MKSLIVIILSLFITSSYGADITCFSGGKIIYSAQADLVAYDENSIVVHDPERNKDIFIFAECIIRV